MDGRPDAPMTDAAAAPGGRYVPKRKNDPAGVRGKILDAAFDLFQSQGYNATSVHEVAAAAGVTGGALHHHFRTKKAIGLAVIRERVARALDAVWLEPLRSAPDTGAAVPGIFESLALELDARKSVRGCPVNNLTLELALADPDYRAELKRLFELWRSTIAQGLAEGPDRDSLAVTVVAAYSGAMALAKVEQSGEPLRLCGRQLKRLL